MLLCSASHNMFLSHYNDSINKIVSSNCIITTKSRCDLFLNYESGIIMYHYRCLSMFGHTARMDDDADAKNDSNSSANRLLEETNHKGVPISHGWAPSSAVWEPTISHWTKQSTWPRTALCGGWCLRMTLCTPSGACQKRRRRRIIVCRNS